MMHWLASIPAWVFMVAIFGLILVSLMRIQDEREAEK